MLINDHILIISNARLALGDRAVEIARNIQEGLNSTDEQKDLRRRVVLSYAVLKMLDRILSINDDDEVEWILGDYSEEKLNRLILFLKDISKSGSRPILSAILHPISEAGLSGGEGQGPQGEDGTNAFVYIGYADDINGAGYSTSATGKSFIAFRQSATAITPVTGATFSGLWRQFVGEDGGDGAPGADGQDVYIYKGYADDVNGTGFTTTFSSIKKWIAIRTSTTPLTPAVGDFAGLWIKYVGEDGAAGGDGSDGNTILSGVGAPAGGLGNDGDYYRDTSNSDFYGPKTAGNWGTPLDLQGEPGNDGNDGGDGAPGADGDDAFVYIAYADAADGTGFTNTYSPTKDWIAIKPSAVEITTPTAGDFTGLWKRYAGDGDRYATTSNTSLTIGTGTRFFIVDPGLSYTTGQRAVIALNGDPFNRMEGVVINYDQPTGQMSVEVDVSVGAGTYSVWDVNLIGAPTSLASQNAYFATIATDQGSGGTPQALSTTPAKITQFDTVVAQSTGMSASAATDDITVANNGAYVLDFNATVSGTASSDQTFQIYVNGTAIPNALARVIFDGSGNPQNVTIHIVDEEVDQNDVFEVRAVASTGTPDLLIEQGRFNVYTIGFINSEQHKEFENLDVDTGTETVDNFLASLGNAVKFEYMVNKGAAFRTGVIFAVWDGTNPPVQNETGTIDIGDTSPLTLDVDFSGGDIRLRATATTDDWIVRGKRTIIG